MALISAVQMSVQEDLAASVGSIQDFPLCIAGDGPETR